MRPETPLGELDDKLQTAVRCVADDPVPEHALRAALDRIAAAEMPAAGAATRTATAPPAASNRRSRWLTSGVLTTAAAAVVIIAGLLFVTAGDGSRAWAQVAEALQGKRWVHAEAQRPDGKPLEFWLSFVRDVSANRRGDWAMFDDHRLGVRYEYDPAKETVLRTAYSEVDEFRSFQGAFRHLFSGGERLGSVFGHEEIITQRWRSSEEGDQTNDELRLTVRSGERVGEIIFLIDPESHLPRLMRLRDLIGEQGQEVLYVLDYPDEGPTDIYALGVPRSAELVDRVPPPELGNILSSVAESRENFDPYHAIVVQVVGEQDPSASLGVYIIQVWFDGKRWRVEGGLPLPTWQKPEPPPEGSDMLALWKQRLEHFRFVPILMCDGDRLYRTAIGEPGAEANQERHWEVIKRLHSATRFGALSHGGAEYFAELHAYPSGVQMPSHLFTASLDRAPSDGPAGSVLVTYEATDQVRGETAYRNLKYWLDPQHGYMTRHYELSGAVVHDGAEPARIEAYAMEQPAQSPRGYWYPTVVRGKNILIEPRDGRQMDQVSYFYLDFDAELPDSLFEPKER